MKKEVKNCENCNSGNLRLEKWIFGKKNRQKFRVKIICLKCGNRKAVKINQVLYELTRVLRWRHKRKKSLEKEGYDFLTINPHPIS